MSYFLSSSLLFFFLNNWVPKNKIMNRIYIKNQKIKFLNIVFVTSLFVSSRSFGELWQQPMAPKKKKNFKFFFSKKAIFFRFSKLFRFRSHSHSIQLSSTHFISISISIWFLKFFKFLFASFEFHSFCLIFFLNFIHFFLNFLFTIL